MKTPHVQILRDMIFSVPSKFVLKVFHKCRVTFKKKVTLHLWKTFKTNFDGSEKIMSLRIWT